MWFWKERMARPLLTAVFLLALAVIDFGAVRADTSFTMKESVQRKLAGRKMKIVTILNTPYVMAKVSDSGSLVGNDRYEGFIPDLLALLSNLLGFEYELYTPPDNKYGGLRNGTWNGMMGEIIKWEKTNGTSGADMVAADIVVSKLRDVHVDFIKPFQNLGYSILMKRPHVFPLEEQFSMFYPLEVGVWICIMIATIVVGLVLWGIYRLHGGPVEDPQGFTLPGSLWFVFTSLLWQGFDRVPRPVGARIMSCVWFVFVAATLVVYISSFVNYFDWITKQEATPFLEIPIDSLDDLVRSELKYGAVSGSTTHRYIKSNKRAEFVEMTKRWESEKVSSMVQSTEDGIDRVRHGGYAFLLSELTAKYYEARHCDLAVVGEPFGQNSLGLAIPVNHPLEEELTHGILELIELGEIERIEHEWWLGQNLCRTVRMTERKRSQLSWNSRIPASKVSLGMMKTPLIFLAVGIFLSLILAMVEQLVYKFKGVSLSGTHMQANGNMPLKDATQL